MIYKIIYNYIELNIIIHKIFFSGLVFINYSDSLVKEI